ncbi:MAG: dCTP deaminase [Neisseriaceae bacterium]|nr:dCTP deaminase [Neisseriaceae bacterium]
MILTDDAIRKLNVEKNLISPFNEDALQSESYDISIGNEITVFNKNVRHIDLKKSDELDTLYSTSTIPESGFTIYPKEYVLVSLNETITLPDNITAHIRPRTRFTRIGLIVSAQHCNSTYSGKLKVGIFNASENAIVIASGIRIAQIVFEELKSVPSEEKQYRNKHSAAYQNEQEFRGYVVPTELQNEVNKAVNFLLGKD